MLDDNILNKFKEAYRDITSDKSWVKTLLLCLFCGCFGLHRFYTRKNKTAIAQLILSVSVLGLPISIIWALYDFFQILYNDFTDSNNKLLDRDITKKNVALITFFFGYMGISDFYIKDYKKGLIKLLLFICYFSSFIPILWNLIDLHLIYLSGTKTNKYSGLKNDFDTKKCLLLLISYLVLIIIFCSLFSSSINYFSFGFDIISTYINNAIKWLLKLILYALCGILIIALIIGSAGDNSKTIDKKTKQKLNEPNDKYTYAIISYKYEDQIFSFKVNDIYKSNINKTIWVTNTKGFNVQAKFLNINNISFAEYNRSELPNYRLNKNFYKK